MPTPYQLVISDKDVIDTMTEVSAPFFQDVLGIPLGECLITDESELSDFCGVGLPDAVADTCSTLAALRIAWDRWVLERIAVRYGVHLATTRIRLVQFFEQLRQSRQPHTLH